MFAAQGGKVERPDARSDGDAALDGTWSRLYAADRQEVRVAVVMIGGVSLAIWIGGVTLELQHLDLAGRDLQETAVPVRVYQELLDFLHARARVDVIAGTSAGGVNGGFLALGVVHQLDLSVLGDVWENQGALSDLLRSPLQKGPPSLLRGDDYYLEKLKDAYRAFEPRGGQFAAVPGPERPVELFLTTTLFAGKEGTFTDDLGRPIQDTEYTGTFAFGTTDSFSDDCGHLGRVAVLDQLATASRCTSSFPGAFEPHWVEVQTPEPGPDGRWKSDAGRASFGRSQYVVDGGVLLNKPIRPALEAIYRQSAQEEVRRVLAYVVPDPGKLAKESPAMNQGSRPPVPVATDVLLSMITRLRTADSVSHELEEIRTRNQRARDRREGRTRIVASLLDGEPPVGADGQPRPVGDSPSRVAVQAWPGYRRVRARLAGLTIGRIIGEAQSEWSAAEIADAVGRASKLPFIPWDPHPADESGTGLELALERSDGDWDWGFTTVQRLGALAIDLLKRALWLTPMEAQELRARIRTARGAVHDILSELRVQVRKSEEFWRRRVPPGAGPKGATAPLERRQTLDSWLQDALEAWRKEPAVANGELYATALKLATQLLNSGRDLREVCAAQISDPREGPVRYLNPLDSEGADFRRLERPLRYLHLDQSVKPEHVLQRMLQLDVVQLAFTGVTDDVEQEVELVEITAAALGPDGTEPDVQNKLTGVQLGHFGAFYRRSWRVNDWIWGRVDGAARLVEMLLSPERMRRLGYQREPVLAKLECLAIGPAGQDRAYLQERWLEAKEACRAELACLDRVDPGRTLPLCARAVARRLQTDILRVELPRLAVAIETEEVTETPVPSDSLLWLQDFRRDVPPGTSAPDISAAVLWKHFGQIGRIGKARIEQEVGSDLFARTVSTGAAVFASVLSAGPGVGRFSAVRSVLHGFRGYALGLWGMVHLATSGARIGPLLTSLAIIVGTGLLALSLVAPGLPGAVAVLGLLAMLAGLTTALLLQSPVLLRRAKLVAYVALLLAIAAAGIAWRYVGAAGLLHGSVNLVREGYHRAPWGRIIRALVVVVAMGVVAFIGGVNLLPRPKKKPS
jgi:patatin-related protein